MRSRLMLGVRGPSSSTIAADADAAPLWIRSGAAVRTGSVGTMSGPQSPTRPRAEALRLVRASSLDLSELVRVFNLGFSDYLVPLQLDGSEMADHIAHNDIDLVCSQVAVDVEPVTVALLARRGREAWLGGMGTAPAYRRIGLGARTLTATIDAAAARGVAAVWLEVLTDNASAIALYERLGFERVRHLEVWSLAPDRERAPVEHRGLDVDAAHAWIAGHRASREPWQRADASIVRMRERGTPLTGVAIERGDAIAGAAICRIDGGTVRVLQIAGVDRAAARDVVIAAAGALTLRLANVPGDDVFAGVLRELGAGVTAAQHEMRLSAGNLASGH
jgi:ribosomal protein S18 acetylase RimI-like enzyme